MLNFFFSHSVYFANMVSKSANYCRVDSRNPVALMSLSEVALGNMYEVKRPEYMEKPKNGYQSTKVFSFFFFSVFLFICLIFNNKKIFSKN